jgi:hypothetical protein
MLHKHAAISAAIETAPPDAAGVSRSGLVARVRHRLFPPSPSSSSTGLPAVYKRKLSFQASIAEMLLVNRLKARTQQDQAAHMLERAAHVIFVTCKNWFATGDDRPTRHETRL